MHIIIISSSIRTGRKSSRVVTYFKNYIDNRKIASTEILDLAEYNFPLFTERLKFLQDPPAPLLTFAEKIRKADGIIIVTPEYNGGYPAALKNAIDVLLEEWQNKPIALVSVSAGGFGASQVLTSLQFTLWKMGAWIVPALFQVPLVEKNYTESGEAVDKEGTDKRAVAFMDKMIWCMQANQKMK